jgi:hypothetical protein
MRVETLGKLDSGAYKDRVQINIDIRATRSGIAGLGHRISERAKESLRRFIPQEKGRGAKHTGC